MKKALSLILALAMVLALVPAYAAPLSTYGDEVWLQDTVLHEGTVLSENTYWSRYYDKPRHEHFVTYSPNSDVTPAAAFGASVCERITVGAATAEYEAKGYRVAAAINGDFYDTATGYPLGLLISGGELLSGSESYYAVGFRRDGSAVIGAPVLQITAEYKGETRPIASLNKPRVEQGGITLFTHDFRTDHTTGTSTAGVSVLATLRRGEAAIGKTLQLRVEEIIEGSAPVAMEEDQVVLTASAASKAENLSFLRSLTPGKTLEVSFTTADPAWEDVTEAVGALYLLVEDGIAKTGFEASSAPRSAVGVTADGDVILYTVDGRQTGYSMGASLGVLAERMVELGCVTAVCLDGGGSTTMVGSLPHSDTAQLLNSPSDLSQRKVSNMILLLARGRSTGRAGFVHLSADTPVVLTGHSAELTAALVDTAYFPMDKEIELTASDGEILGTTFIAPQTPGYVTVTASSGRREASIDILVVDAPDEMTVRWGEKAITSMTMVPGDKADLSVTAAYAHVPLETDFSAFRWDLDPNLGSIDETGLLTTNFTEGSGEIRISRGGTAVAIPLTLDGASPFADTERHWGSPYMAALYHRGVLTGEAHEDGLYAFPDESVTRAEFAVLLFRYLGLNEADYAAVEVPFADMDKVDAWADPAARAMYALGIINGVASGSQVYFDPHGTLTRAQTVTMLGRLLDGPLPAADLSGFTDAASVPDYALPYFKALVAMEVIAGSYGKLDPNGTLVRAAICKMLATMG